MQIALTQKGQAALWVTKGCTSMSKQYYIVYAHGRRQLETRVNMLLKAVRKGPVVTGRKFQSHDKTAPRRRIIKVLATIATSKGTLV